MPKQYVLVINEFEKAIIEYAVQFIVDNCATNEMRAIKPSMAEDLKRMVNKIEEKGEYATGI